MRELLLNVVKHAGTDRAELAIVANDDRVAIQVADKGTGFNHADKINNCAAGNGFGLFNVRQRIEQMGGYFGIESAPGFGTVVTLTIPLAEISLGD